MAAFYLDHDVARQLEQALLQDGHDVCTARQRGQQKAGDSYHLLAATQESRILIVHNARDYRLLHQAWRCWMPVWNNGPPHGGILILPQQIAAQTPLLALTWITRLLSSGRPIAGHCYECNGGWWAEVR